MISNKILEAVLANRPIPLDVVSHRKTVQLERDGTYEKLKQWYGLDEINRIRELRETWSRDV